MEFSEKSGPDTFLIFFRIVVSGRRFDCYMVSVVSGIVLDIISKLSESFAFGDLSYFVV